MSDSSPSFRLIALAVALAAVVSTAVAAPWYEDYDKGMKALAGKRYQEAVRFLESAIASRPESMKSARTYGQRFVDYYPYYHLGRAYAGLGEPQKARAAYEDSEKRGELSKEGALARELTQELGRLRLADSGTQPPRTEPKPAGLSAAERKRIEDALAGAESLISQGKPAEAQSRLSDLRGSLPPAGETPEGDALRQRADAALEHARTAAEKAAREDAARSERAAALDRSAALERSVSAARAALRQGNLSVARTELERARAADPQSRDVRALEADVRDAEAKQQARGAVLRLLGEGQALFNQKRFEEARSKFAAALEREPANADAQAWLRRAADALAASLTGAEKDKRVAEAMKDVKTLAGERQIRPAMERLKAAEALGGKSAEMTTLSRDVVEAARAKARAAVAQQLQGRYDRASVDLEDALAALGDRAQAHLYLAFSFYSRYLAEGEKDQALAERARAGMREALRLDPRLAPDPRIVSPRLLAALDEIRKRP